MENNISTSDLTDELTTKKKAKETLKKVFDSKIINFETLNYLRATFKKQESNITKEVLNRIDDIISNVRNSNKKFTEIISNNQTVLKDLISTSEKWGKISSPLTYYGAKLENLLISKKNINMHYIRFAFI